ncbi:hypothetical protein GQ53DRAFT_815842 [Thozetella sp. PMI_491]|nr:hypothetical protein GQ53DRAFT_815842 [Thozetella sp. PMI_491]
MEFADNLPLRLLREDERRDEVELPKLSGSQAMNLYISHAFSTWNARGYKFATILFTAAAYPDTLAVSALRMAIEYLAMVLFSASVGQWVNNSPNRLRTLSTTIMTNRGAVILAAFVWMATLSQDDLAGGDGFLSLPKSGTIRGLLFVVAVTLGILERLSAAANFISMERDWVVAVAAPAGQPYDLTDLNAVMRRIDLVCKLFSPIAISLIISAVGSTRVGILYAGFTSLFCLPVELFSAKRAWSSSEALQSPKLVERPPPAAEGTTMTKYRTSWGERAMSRLRGFEFYFSSVVFIPSFTLALLHGSVLTWKATFITHLINVGYSLNFITIARTVGSCFEIGSTVLTPIGVRYAGRALHHGASASQPVEDDEAIAFLDGQRDAAGGEEHESEQRLEGETIVGLQRFGLWGFTLLVAMLVPVLWILWTVSPQSMEGGSSSNAVSPPLGLSVLLFGFLSISRLGVWIYELTTQQLSQSLVPESERATFAGVEVSVLSVVQLTAGGVTIAFQNTAQFKWLALASWAVVMISWVAYVM